MKIRLSEDEVYEIKMPEEIEIQEFSAIVSKFNFLIKNLTKFGIGESNTQGNGIVLSPNVTKQYNSNKNTWITFRDKRSVLVEVLRAYYLGSVQNFEEILKKYNLFLQRQEISINRMKVLIEMHKIKPQELGLSQFPTKTKTIRDCILKQE